MEAFTSYAPFLGVGGLIIALIIYLRVKSQPTGSGLMVEIADEIHAGAMVYLKRQYSILFFVVAAIAILIWFVPSLGPGTAIAYVSGALCSVVAGYFGMMSATKANVRTAEAANRYKPDAARALSVAFNGGAVMGLSITSIGLIGIGIFFFYLNYGTPATAYEIN
ncbi:Pyrophosphate-energized proton pump, partial [hydrothermal vent metagenome]